MVETESGITVKRASSFRIPMSIQRKRPKQATMKDYDSQTAMPLKSQGWRGSVEVISDVELTVSDTEMCSSSRSRRKIVPKYISGFVYRSSPVSCDQQSWDSSSTKWRKYYAVTSGSVIAVSDPTSFMLQEKIKLNKALIKECRLRGRGVLFIQLNNEDKGFLLRFKDRIERRNWYQVLNSSPPTPHPLSISSAYPVTIKENTILYSDHESHSSGTESYNPRKRLKVISGYPANCSSLSSSIRNTSQHCMSPRAMSHLGGFGDLPLDQSSDQEKKKSRRRSAIDFLKNFKSKFEILKPTAAKATRKSKRLSVN